MDWSISGIIRAGASEHPDLPMITGVGAAGDAVTRTWGEEDERTNRVAHALAAEGVGPGDRVAFLDKNVPAFFDLLFGGAKLNAVGVSVNWRLAPPEMVHIINDAEARVLVVGADFAGHLAAFEDQLESVRRIVMVDGDHPKHDDLDAWISGRPATDPGVQPAPDDVAIQLYTSGTTGLPKGVMLSNRNLGTGVALAGEVSLTRSSVNLAAMPLFHIGGTGWALAGLTVGAHTVIPREVDPVAILGIIEEHRITSAFLVPAVLQFMLAVPGATGRDYSSLEAIAYGASPISEDVLARCLATFGCDFVQLYGLTETTGAITVLRPEQHADPARLRSCGAPFDHIELRIVDPESGEDRPVGEVGELWTRSAQNMVGYWHKPDETARTVDADGWLRTGDAGYRDDEGFVYLHDRIKDMIVSGGENIFPAEVENVLMSHPGVADAAAIGVPHERWGETVKAIVVAAPGGAPAAEDIIAFCRERLAHFKCPTSVDFVAALPRNPSGKILKRELRAPYWEGRTRNVN